MQVTMQRAELAMAVVLALLSLYLMWKSQELSVGWIRGQGPGGGAFPFWLAVGMLISCIVIIVRWFLKASPLSRSSEVFLSGAASRMLFTQAVALAVTIALFHVVGVYVSLPLFLIFHLRILGAYSWRLTAAMAGATPVVLFVFFELILHISMPKGVTEPMFYPIYEIIY